jgi:hypothetical protein
MENKALIVVVLPEKAGPKYTILILIVLSTWFTIKLHVNLEIAF